MPTLELQDPLAKFTTVDFLGSTYQAVWGTLQGFGDSAFDGVPFVAPENQYRVRSFQIHIVGSSESNLIDVHENLLNDLTVCRDRYRDDPDNAAELHIQIGTTNTNDIVYRVRRAWMAEPSNVISTVFVNQNLVRSATIFLETEAIGERNTSSTSILSAFENEVDGANLNYVAYTLGSDEAERALLDIKVSDPNNADTTPPLTEWNGSKKMVIWMREGDGSTDTTFFQDATAVAPTITTPIQGVTTNTSGTTGGLTTNASGGLSAYVDYVYSSGSSAEKVGWTSLFYLPITISAANLPYGVFEVWARVAWEEVVGTTSYDNDGTDIAWALGYSFGGVTSTPTPGGTTASDKALDGDYIPMSVDVDTWELINIGRITIPPRNVPSSLTAPDLELRVYAAAFGTGALWTTPSEFRLSLDYVQLADIRSNYTVVEGVSTGDEVRIISQGKNTGVFITNASDVIQSVPTYHGSSIWTLGGQGSRVHFLRDDSGDPSDIQAAMEITAHRRTRGAF